MSATQSLNFKKLVEAHYASLYRFAYSLANNEHQACDLTQHTFFIYANKSASIRDASKIKSWLFTTLYHEFLRQRRTDQRVETREAASLETVAPPVESEVVAALDGASAVAALEQLDETFRTPLALFYLQDLSYKEIADLLEVPIGTVMSRLSRGKALLKKTLIDRALPG